MNAKPTKPNYLKFSFEIKIGTSSDYSSSHIIRISKDCLFPKDCNDLEKELRSQISKEIKEAFAGAELPQLETTDGEL